MARILLAEDDEDLRRFLTAALRRAGHEVEERGRGDDAFEAIRRDGPFDLLLADIVMPAMDGIELAKRAAVLDPTMRVMFITGFAAVSLRMGQDAPAATQVLSKPFHLRELIANVDQVLDAA